MKKLIVAFFALVIIVVLVSWGGVGHRTVADIAYNHLTPAARAAVADLLGKESLADVASWADELRNDPNYRNTGPEHYINVELGLSHADFQKQVERSEKTNVYLALLKNEGILTDRASTKEQKTDALKFIVHYVGDMHQPMHVSRAEDKGGNTIQVRYEGKGTNLHSLWDSKLLEHDGLKDDQLAKQYDNVSAGTITSWQKDAPIEWAWESYQISTQLYAEIAAMKDNTITEEYYNKHIGIIQKRIQQAGIRLAGVLNTIFKNGVAASAASSAHAAAAVTGSEKEAAAAGKDAGAGKEVCDKVYGGKYFDNSGMTLLNLGAAYPNSTMTVVIYKKDRDKWSQDPISLYNGKKICVTGKAHDYNGKPEIIVSSPDEIKIVN